MRNLRDTCNRLSLGLWLVSFVASFICSSPVRAGELSPELPEGAQVKREEPTWGKEQNGLQLGISLCYLNRQYHIGEEAAFLLEVRNVSRKSIKLTYDEYCCWWLSPNVVDEKGNPLSIEQQILLWGEDIGINPSTVTKILAPDQVLALGRAQLNIGPPVKGQSEPTLHVPPGKYKITYDYRFQGDVNEPKTAELKSWVGNLTSGSLILEIVAAK